MQGSPAHPSLLSVFRAEGVLSPKKCDWLVEVAENHAKTHGGWTTGRHKSYPTTDLPINSLGEATLGWFNNELRGNIIPLLARLFGFEAMRIRLQDAFVVKYQAGAGGSGNNKGSGGGGGDRGIAPLPSQSQLPVHSDESLFSFTILLNDRANFEGGGTFFEALGRPINAAAKGGMLAHSGRLRHGGQRITNGTRYILAAFLHLRYPCAGSAGADGENTLRGED